MASKHIWHQADRESGLVKARRTVIKAHALVEAMGDQVGDSFLSDLGTTTVFYGRALAPLREALSGARVLLAAYDYFLARCQEGGISLEQAEAAWQVHSSEAFEAEMIDAESYGPNALHMLDEKILVHLGLPPHADLVDDADDKAEP